MNPRSDYTRRKEDGPMTFEKIISWAMTLTWPKLIIAATAVVVGIAGLTLYENRQKVFADLQSARLTDDFKIEPPTKAGDEVFEAFLRSHPEVLMISLIDANPITNRREVVRRYFNNSDLKKVVLDAVAVNPGIGDGPLLTAEPQMNSQVLKILNGEFHCDPAAVGPIFKAFPDAIRVVKYSCRVPLPPAFNRATGWLTLHLSKWPIDDLERFKMAGLQLSQTYYYTDISKTLIKVNH